MTIFPVGPLVFTVHTESYRCNRTRKHVGRTITTENFGSITPAVPHRNRPSPLFMRFPGRFLVDFGLLLSHAPSVSPPTAQYGLPRGATQGLKSVDADVDF
jgi:hypothetical protein